MVWTLAAGAADAQGVQIGQDAVEIVSPTGAGVVTRMDSTGTLQLGGSDKNGSLFIRKGTSGEITFSIDGLGNMAVGSGPGGGEIHVKDSAGIPRISLFGQEGVLRVGSTTPGEDGDISVADANGVIRINLDGDTASATNALDGEGLVKAWAKVDPGAAGGIVLSCYRCDASKSSKFALGTF